MELLYTTPSAVFISEIRPTFLLQETTSGTENVVNKKHALVRYQTATGEFEVELEGVPAVFEVSHATGRLASSPRRISVRISVRKHNIIYIMLVGVSPASHCSRTYF